MTTTREFERFGFFVSQMTRMWRSEIDRRLAVHGLTESLWVTLFHLSRLGDQVTQKDLAEAVGVKGPTMVKTLDKLEAEGFIERRSLATDRRAKTIHLLDKAAGKLTVINEVVTNLRNEIFADIDETDIATSLKVINHISQKLSSMDGFE